MEFLKILQIIVKSLALAKMGQINICADQRSCAYPSAFG